MSVPHVNEWEVENSWRILQDFYEERRAMGPSCLAKGVIGFNQNHDLLPANLDELSDDEFVELFMQAKMTRPEMELNALGYLLVELVGTDSFTRDSEADLDVLIAKLHEVGGYAGLLRIWEERGCPKPETIGSRDSVALGQ